MGNMKDRVKNSMAIGLAGEFRVMSELLLRGLNPSKSYLDTGIDITLDNGKTIQVKSAKKRRESRNYERYLLTLLGNGKNRAEFFVFWCIDDDDFFIVPTNKINGKRSIVFSPGAKNAKYMDFKNKWELLL